ncbi:hypothetical protein JKP88DRAFT_244413 [Tribonema minus]|uniref:Uncharacterized protein n=1 Tax=Tribonema minus TaxID=303371 RepID=A0A836CG53_9STRA|nr:hypothetical protein JKP88DRAFT_244413 [Tribonema minus]
MAQALQRMTPYDVATASVKNGGAILLATSSIPTFPSEQDLNAFAMYGAYSLLDCISINQFRQPGSDGCLISALLFHPKQLPATPPPLPPPPADLQQTLHPPLWACPLRWTRPLPPPPQALTSPAPPLHARGARRPQSRQAACLFAQHWDSPRRSGRRRDDPQTRRRQEPTGLPRRRVSSRRPHRARRHGVVERFISYMETQKVTAPHDICHYAFLSLKGEAHALATSLRQADTWPTSFTGIAQILLEHFAPPAAFKDSCRVVVDLKQGPKETSKAYTRTLQQVSTLYGQVRRTRAVSVDGHDSASANPLPKLQECLFLTILEGGLLPGLRQQMRLQTHFRFNEEEMVASLQRIERTIVLRNTENSTATNGAGSANFMPPQHGSPSPFNSSPSADYVIDDTRTSLNYGNNNGNGDRNGSGRRPYC